MATAIVEAPKKPNESDHLALSAPTPMELLSLALTNNAAIDIIERLAALQEKFLARDAEIQFNEALSRVQSEVARVVPDLTNPQTHSKYASYAAIDKVVRPIYVKEGFSLSFDTDECLTPEHVRVVGFLSRGAHTRKYKVDMPSDGKGAKGGDVMTKTHATASAMSYGQRYLTKNIFNVAIGEQDTDGNATNGELAEQIEWIQSARNHDELKRIYRQAYEKFESNPAALKAIIAARKARQEEL